jgi:hypothetical protein
MPQPLLSRALLVLASVAIAPIAARAGVHTVGGPSPDFTTIQAAIDASIDGDVVLVRGGGHHGFTIDGKAVAIVADPHFGQPTVDQMVTIKLLTPFQSVVLSGLRIFATGTEALHAEYVEGTVRCYGLTLRGGNATPITIPGHAAARLIDCVDFAFVSCRLFGGSGVLYVMSGGPALVSSGSNVALYSSTLRGGEGAGGTPLEGATPGGDGGDGCVLHDGFLFASSTRFEGGAGGNGGTIQCFTSFDGGDGGDGLVAPLASPAFATLVDCTFAGGVAGLAHPCVTPAQDGVPGIPRVGDATFLDGASRTLRAHVVARESESAAIAVTGAPGEEVVLFVATYDDYTYAPQLYGVAHLLPPIERRFSIGTIPASGVLITSLPIGELGPGVEASMQRMQALVLGPSGSARLTNPTALVALDASF